MNILFHKMRTGRKGQIMAVLTVALITFIIAAFLAVNIGKSKIQGVKVKNGAQAAVLGGGSAAAVMLNSMANINDQMVLNFAGFTVMIQFLLISWIIDYVMTLVTAFSTFTWFNVTGVVNTLFSVMTLCLTTATIALLIAGATKVGNAIYKMIRELNDKLPKNSRDTARQYGFSNAGVDEPKVPRKNMDPWAYSLIETKFDEFMRVMPQLNRADKNYGTSKIWFSWNDLRTGHSVTNRVDLTVTPVQKVPLRLVKFGEVAGMAGEINSYLSGQDLGYLGPIIRFGVRIANIIIGMIWATAALILALGGILIAIGAVQTGMAAGYMATCLSCSWFFCTCCWACFVAAYFAYSAGFMYASAAIAIAASIAFFIIYDSNPPGDIPCFVMELRKEHPITASINRSTSPASINYGIYTTTWPSQSSSAGATVKDGSIFPPNQKYDVYLN